MAFISFRLTDDYATSPWSFHTRALRHALNDHSGVNYATFWFRIGALGAIQQRTDRSAGGFHSEKNVWQNHLNGMAPFNAILVPNWLAGQVGGANTTANAALAAGSGILLVYTEREPCGTCSPFLGDVLPDNTYVCWHFQYASEETGKYKHDGESTAVFAMDQLKHGTYDSSREKDTRKDSRKSGNYEHKQTMKGMGTGWAQGPGSLPLTAVARAIMAG